MRSRNWRDPADYAYTATLGREHWAWEFLRRNHEYRADWEWFSATWRALEEEYGRPPDRDFQRWRRDPRAYRAVNTGLAPRTVQLTENADAYPLIECWMGSKWGFFKFPLDPDIDMPQLGEQLAWRPVPLHAVPLATAHEPLMHATTMKSATTAALVFDLSLPLKAQLEAAKYYLVAQQRNVRRQGQNLSLRTADHAHRWTLCLRAHDAGLGGTKPDELAAALFPGDVNADIALSALLTETLLLCGGGHRRVLLLED